MNNIFLLSAMRFYVKTALPPSGWLAREALRPLPLLSTSVSASDLFPVPDYFAASAPLTGMSGVSEPALELTQELTQELTLREYQQVPCKRKETDITPDVVEWRAIAFSLVGRISRIARDRDTDSRFFQEWCPDSSRIFHSQRHSLPLLLCFPRCSSADRN